MTSTAEQSAARRSGRIAAGVCVDCALFPPVEGRTLCEECLRRDRDGRSALTSQRLAAGQCTNCGAIAPAGMSKCLRHQQSAKASQARYRKSRSGCTEVVIKRLVRAARDRALERGLEFSIEPADLGEPPTHCSILGLKLQYERPGVKGPRDASPSIDRIDNALGYIKGNVRVISHRANRLRSDATLAELQAITRDMQLVATTTPSLH